MYYMKHQTYVFFKYNMQKDLFCEQKTYNKQRLSFSLILIWDEILTKIKCLKTSILKYKSGDTSCDMEIQITYDMNDTMYFSMKL